MATIASYDFASEDEEDEEYVGSDKESLSDGDDDGQRNGRNANNVQKSIARKKAYRVLQEMKAQSIADIQHRCTIHKDDVLLQFQRKAPNLKQSFANEEQFLDFVQTARGGVVESADQRFNIPTFKESCRSEIMSVWGDDTASTIDFNSSTLCTITQDVKFAGRTLKMSTNVVSGSKKHIDYLKKQKAAENILSIDKLMLDTMEPKKINTIDKSQADWRIYKECTGLEDQMKQHRKDGFLGRQAFLQESDAKIENAAAVAAANKRRKPLYHN